MKSVLNETQTKEIISLYTDGMGSEEIARKYNVSGTAIIKLLKRNDVDIRSFRDKLKEKHNEIIGLYTSGNSSPQIAKMFNVNHSVIIKVLNKYKVQRH